MAMCQIRTSIQYPDTVNLSTDVEFDKLIFKLQYSKLHVIVKVSVLAFDICVETLVCSGTDRLFRGVSG